MKTTFKLSILILLLACGALLASCAASPLSEGDARAYIADSENDIVIEAVFSEKVQNANAGKTVSLFQIDAGVASYDLASLIPAAETKMANRVTFTLPLYNGGSSSLCGSFVLATYDSLKNGYTELTDRLYVENPEKLAEKTEESPKYESIKGVNAESTALAASLGVSHSLIDIYIEDYITDPSAPFAVRHEFDGVSVFFDGNAVSALENKVNALCRVGSAVYFRVLLGSSDGELEDEKKFLSYPDTEPDEGSYAINYGNREAFISYSALCSLLVDRFCSDTDISFIVGRGVNSYDLGTEIAELKSGVFATEYAAALRVTYNILRSRTLGGNVFAAIDHRLTVARSTDHLTGEAFLLDLATAIGQDSDFLWGVASEIRAGTSAADRVWYESENSSLLKPSKFSALTNEILGRAELLYSDWCRPVIISDLLIATGSGSTSEEYQAASYAYTYYQAVKDGKISALIYGSAFGEQNGLASENGERAICDMMRKIDTDKNIHEEVSAVVGSSWDRLSLNKDLADRVKRGKYMTGSAAVDSSAGYALSSLFGFDTGELGAIETLGGGYIGLKKSDGRSRLFASFDPETDEDICGIAVFGIDASLIGGDYLAIPLSVTSDGDAATDDFTVTLTLLQNDPSGEVRNYVSSIKVSPDTETDAMFDISKFSESKSDGEVTFLLTVRGSDDQPFTLNVDKVMSAKQPSTVIWIVVLVILGVLVLGAAVAVFVIWFRKNYTINFGSRKENAQ
ncbi:MAG: hypothetical protein E7640_05080 [Ruminococcaceae bacterium]|nr:hypothetical protein [Oscillospiraceae bacterium]